MCGIAGFVDFSGRSSAETLRATALRMARTLRHRGPDDEGVWTDPECGVALAMRRLAVLDLSPAGRQPMQSASGRYTIVSNGEIYNCEDLREELTARVPGLMFRGHSDTEVMLAAFDHWGVRESVRRFNGMFAFAAWDAERRELHLASDRFGEKPLYYSLTSRGVIFGSELKALREHPDFDSEIDRNALALFLRYNCIPAPFSIHRHTSRMTPATLLSLSQASFSNATPESYWSLEAVVHCALTDPFCGTESEAADELDILLRRAVYRRMRSDVSLGAFLSGGVDSSTVVALMQAQSTHPIKTFTIGVPDTDYDEGPQAAAVARHLGTDHKTVPVTASDVMAVLPQLPRIYDEPFADSSQIPTYLVARLAREHVTVCLSGDGGDEVFGGYNRHVWCAGTGQWLNRFPRGIRFAAAGVLTAFSPNAWDKMTAVTRGAAGPRMAGYKVHKLAAVLRSDDQYRTLRSHWTESESVVVEGSEPELAGVESQLSGAELMMFCDTATYLPDDILVKLDRATMAVGLEARAPFLDPAVVEFAWRLPLAMKIRNGRGKCILRTVLDRYVPRHLVDRPKTGFGIPLDRWLAGTLREWCEALLAEDRLRREGFLHPQTIRKKWTEYLAGNTYWTWHLWDVLMFQAWLEGSCEMEADAGDCGPSCW